MSGVSLSRAPPGLPPPAQISHCEVARCPLYTVVVTGVSGALFFGCAPEALVAAVGSAVAPALFSCMSGFAVAQHGIDVTCGQAARLVKRTNEVLQRCTTLLGQQKQTIQKVEEVEKTAATVVDKEAVELKEVAREERKMGEELDRADSSVELWRKEEEKLNGLIAHLQTELAEAKGLAASSENASKEKEALLQEARSEIAQLSEQTSKLMIENAALQTDAVAIGTAEAKLAETTAQLVAAEQRLREAEERRAGQLKQEEAVSHAGADAFLKQAAALSSALHSGERS